MLDHLFVEMFLVLRLRLRRAIARGPSICGHVGRGQEAGIDRLRLAGGRGERSELEERGAMNKVEEERTNDVSAGVGPRIWMMSARVDLLETTNENRRGRGAGEKKERKRMGRWEREERRGREERQLQRI